jgi:hypothetical protein
MILAHFKKYQIKVGAWLKRYSACLDSVRPRVQTAVLPKKVVTNQHEKSIVILYNNMSNLKIKLRKTLNICNINKRSIRY